MTQVPASLAADAPGRRIDGDAPRGDGFIGLPGRLGIIGMICGFAVYHLAMASEALGAAIWASLACACGALAVGSAFLLSWDGQAARVRSSIAVLAAALLFGLSASTAARQSIGGLLGNGNVWPLLAMATALMLALPFAARWIASDGPFARRFRLSTPAEVIRPFWIAVVMAGVGGLFVLACLALQALVAFLLSSLGFSDAADIVFAGPLPTMVMFGAFGLALGTLRRRPGMTDTLLRLAGTILGLLTPVAMVVVMAFLILLSLQLVSGTGGGLSVGTAALAAGLVAALLLNAAHADPDVRGDADAEAEMTARVAGWRRWPAMLLAASILPLGTVAAIALGVRIADHGLTHERLWGLVAAVIAIAYGIACLLAVRAGPARFEPVLGHHQGRWMAGAAIVLVLTALQPVDFGRLAVADQMARLADGRTSARDFDAGALERLFGDDGQKAVDRLAARDDRIGQEARRTIANRDLRGVNAPPAEARARSVRDNVIGKSADIAVDAALSKALAGSACARNACHLVRDGADRIIVISAPMFPHVNQILDRTARGWTIRDAAPATATPREIDADSVITLRDVSRREIVIDGRPTGVLAD